MENVPLCQRWNNRGQKRGVIDRSILQNNVLYYFRELIVLSDNRETQKKTPVKRKDVGAEYDLINDLGFNLCVVP